MRPCPRSPRSHSRLTLPLAAAAALGMTGAAASAATATTAPAATPRVPIAALQDVRLAAHSKPLVTAFPIDTYPVPPLNGFRPQVVFGLTDEQEDDDFSFAAKRSSFPSGSTLPVGGPAKYFVATFDTGASTHIVTYDAIEQLNLEGADRFGENEAALQGATGNIEFANITDALGIYMAGFQDVTSGGPNPAVVPNALKGQWNVSILHSQGGSQLPNIIGAPMVAQYQTVIKTSQTHELDIAGAVERTPAVSFQPLDTPMPGGYGKLSFNVQSANGVAPDPTYFPSTEGIFEGPVENNPDAPTQWGGLWTPTTVRNTADDGENLTYTDEFLFDTGAQVSVLSKITAANVGIYTDGTDPTPADFQVEVLGVGGVITVPGYYIDNLRLTTTGGAVNFANVPVIVLDIIDPRDLTGEMPGIIGMNLFTERDLIINGGTGAPAAYIGPQFRQWNAAAGGDWNDATKWKTAVPNGPNIPATFYSAISTPQSINVNGNYTVGSLSFDNAAAPYTLAGAGRITMNSAGQPAALFVGAGSHAITARMTFATDTALVVSKPASTLTLSGDLDAAPGVTLFKSGPGAVAMKHVRAHALDIKAGTVKVLPGGGPTRSSALDQLAISPLGRLDLSDNALVIRDALPGTAHPDGDARRYNGVQGLVQSGYNLGEWNGAGGIITSRGADAGGIMTLGVASADETAIAGETWQGQAVTPGDVLVLFTFAGDANLDGFVDGGDYAWIDAYVNAAAPDVSYLHGDFNYDGFIDGGDYAYIDVTVGSSLPPPAAAPGGTLATVPEPSACGFALLAALTALAHRPRRTPRRR